MLLARLELELNYYCEWIGKSSPSCYLFSESENKCRCPLGRFVHVKHGCSVKVLADGKVSLRCLSQRCRNFPSKELNPIDLMDPTLRSHRDGSYLTFESFLPAFSSDRTNAASFQNILLPGAQLEREVITTAEEEYLRLRVRKEDVISWGTRYQEIVPIVTRRGRRLPPLRNLVEDVCGNPFPERMAISIRSPIDTGKTTMVKQYLEDANHVAMNDRLPIVRVLMLSVRQSMTDDLIRNYGPLGFVDYRDCTNSNVLRNHDKLILQIDSLHRLKSPFDGIPLPNYDVIIFDEVSYGLGHFSYKEMENKVTNIGLLEYYLKTTPRIITMDADHGYKATDFLTHIRDDFILIWNINPPPTNKDIILYHHKGRWFQRLFEAVQRGERIAVPTNSKRTAKAIRRRLIDKGIVEESKILLVCSESTKEERDLLKDCNTAFLRYDVLIYTPTIGPGVDFHVFHFDHIFAYGVRNSNTATDFAQGIGRIRKTTLVHLFTDRDRSPRDQDLVTAASLTKYISWSVVRFEEKMNMEYFGYSIDPVTGRLSLLHAEENLYFRLAFHNRLDVEESELRFRSILLEKFEAMGYTILQDSRDNVEAAREIRQTDKVLSSEQDERNIAVEVTEKPPPRSTRNEGPPSAANIAHEFDRITAVRDGHRDAAFYRRHKGLQHIRNAEMMLETDEESERKDINRMGVDPTTGISGRFRTTFQEVRSGCAGYLREFGRASSIRPRSKSSPTVDIQHILNALHEGEDHGGGDPLPFDRCPSSDCLVCFEHHLRIADVLETLVRREMLHPYDHP